MTKYFILYVFLFLNSFFAYSQQRKEESAFKVMEYNVENLFDCQHDTLKEDYEFSENGSYKWTYGKYWKKLNAVARSIVLSSTRNNELSLPDIIGLCEVENDSVVFSLAHRSLLRGAGYEYVMTNSPDRRGVDVALLYQPFSFRLLSSYSLRVDTIQGMKPTRDILYAKGETLSGNLNVFVIHAPSRGGGEAQTRPYRLQVIQRLCTSIDSLRQQEPAANILVMGDFNDYDGDASLEYLKTHQLTDITTKNYITKNKQVQGTYRYQGEWGSLDHILVSDSMLQNFCSSEISSHPDLLEEDTKYGGMKPFRFFRGPIMHGGYSDHLPLIATFRMK